MVYAVYSNMALSQVGSVLCHPRSTTSMPNRDVASHSVNRSSMAFMESRMTNGSWGLFGIPSSSWASRVRVSPTSTLTEHLKTADVSTPKLPPLPDKRVVAGVGTITLDFLASVASYPEPDAKIRSLDSLAQGGGNVGNALTAVARLGLSPKIFSKLANDAAGIGILRELQSDGVNVAHIVVAKEGVSPFTYVIVDRETKTRTCIHTPGHPPFEPKELSESAICSFLEGADLLYLDGRIPDAAFPILQEATNRQIPVILDAERKRDGLDEMIVFADYLVTSAKFPQAWTNAPTLAEALISMALKLPRLKFVIVTQGSAGCVMLERSSSETTDVLDPNATLLSLQEKAKEWQNSSSVVFSSQVAVILQSSSGHTSDDAIVGRLLVGTAASLSSAEVVDTTGAGDAFIGGIIYSILAGFSPEKMLPLGATVAAAKCRALGARTGLPLRGYASLLPLLL